LRARRGPLQLCTRLHSELLRCLPPTTPHLCGTAACSPDRSITAKAHVHGRNTTTLQTIYFASSSLPYSCNANFCLPWGFVKLQTVPCFPLCASSQCGSTTTPIQTANHNHKVVRLDFLHVYTSVSCLVFCTTHASLSPSHLPTCCTRSEVSVDLACKRTTHMPVVPALINQTSC
jgi:hypothetical protein